MARRIAAKHPAGAPDPASLERRLRWLVVAPWLPVRDPEPPGVRERADAMRAIAARVADSGGHVADQVAAVEAALSGVELARVDRLLAHLTSNTSPNHRRTR